MTYEEDDEVLVKYPLTQAQEDGPRADWPWLPGWIARECGVDEWEVVIEDDRLAMLDEQGEVVYPVVFRDSSEIQDRS
jgi:hypothetical protein